MEAENGFKTALARGDTLYGFWLALADPYSAEVCAGAGFDWLLIDGEHAPNDVRSTLAQLQAVAPFSTHAVVRPPSGDPVRIKQLLDLGARSLLIPMVESAAQARDLVAATRYPPRGIRGVGSAVARASGFSRNAGYLRHADENICLLVQVESAPALEALDSIARVEGVDGVFVGPADLAASLGHLGEPGHPEVQAAIQDAGARLRAAGRPAGVLATDEGVARTYLGWGYTFVAVGVDTILLARATSALVARFKT